MYSEPDVFPFPRQPLRACKINSASHDGISRNASDKDLVYF